jgi:FkbM family methyltransferase
MISNHSLLFFSFWLEERTPQPPLSVLITGANQAALQPKFPQPNLYSWLPQAELLLLEPLEISRRRFELVLSPLPANSTCLPSALTENDGPHLFYETIRPEHSSLCRPNLSALDDYFGGEGYKLQSTSSVSGRSLSSLVADRGGRAFDTLILDVNGAEGLILNSAPALVTHLKALLLTTPHPDFYEIPEGIEFAPLLKTAGLRAYRTRTSGSFHLRHCPTSSARLFRQHHTLYLPSPARCREMSPENLLSTAGLCWLHEVYDLFEYTLRLYDTLTKSTLRKDFQTAFAAKFHPGSAPPQGLRASPIAEESGPRMTLELPGSIAIRLPNRWDRLTSFVVAEQEDWFEAELSWLRRWLRPGMHVLDIGASYGIYALTAAAAVGAEGKVWAVEPAPEIFDCLQESVEMNEFLQLSVWPAALSLKEGEATFYLGDDAESSSLLPSALATCIRVKTQTLSSFSLEHHLANIDLIKLDTAGEELNIIESGGEWLASQNPLLLFKYMHEGRAQTDLLEKLQDRGFDIYRLVPGLSLLAKFQAGEKVDSQHGQLFACSRSRAESLAAEGRLALEPLSLSSADLTTEAWPHYLAQLPYGQAFLPTLPADWRTRRAGAETHAQGLTAFSLALLPSFSPEKRVALAGLAVTLLEKALREECTLARLLSLARAGLAYGRRDLAADILGNLTENILGNAGFYLDEPFLCPSPDFDLLPLGSDPAKWCISAVLHQYLLSGRPSLYYWPKPPAAVFQKLAEYNFLLPAMHRRREIVRLAFT